jgi:hypothetical protein
MPKRTALSLVIALLAGVACGADSPVKTPRPVPATRTEMKELLEDMKQRPYRIPLPELTDEEKAALGERGSSYESRLRSLYVPQQEGTVFGGGGPRPGAAGERGAPGQKAGSATGGAAPRRDFSRNADENMTLTYQFKTMLFRIVARTNNCQYCLGHQEWKLSATGMSDDAIAALDADRSSYSEAEQAAFAYARLLIYEPQRLSDEEIARVQKLLYTSANCRNDDVDGWQHCHQSLERGHWHSAVVRQHFWGGEVALLLPLLQRNIQKHFWHRRQRVSRMLVRLSRRWRSLTASPVAMALRIDRNWKLATKCWQCWRKLPSELLDCR